MCLLNLLQHLPLAVILLLARTAPYNHSTIGPNTNNLILIEPPNPINSIFMFIQRKQYFGILSLLKNAHQIS